MYAAYEPHHFENPKFPIFFHFSYLHRGQMFEPHWHENWEILYFTKGTGRVGINMQDLRVKAGETVIVPSAAIHFISSDCELLEYYCLIVDHSFCAAFGFEVEKNFFCLKTEDAGLAEKIEHIAEEFRQQQECLHAEILAETISLLVYLTRNFSVEAPLPLSKAQSAHHDIVKHAFSYVEAHYSNPLSVDELAEAVGFSKYYFCHIFKKVTGMTPGVYIGFVRCRHAEELLSSGSSVSEAATQCGFENLSYFSKTYKRYIGELPSQTSKASV